MVLKRILDPIIHPSMQWPEDRIDMRTVKITQGIVGWHVPLHVPLRIDIVGTFHDQLTGLLVPRWNSSPSHVHPVVNRELKNIPVRGQREFCE